MKVYQSPSLTVDAIVQNKDKILTIRRKNDPFKDNLALPGGFVNYGERVEDAVIREILEETSIEISPVHVLGVYSDPIRDPRKHTVSIAFVGIIVSGEAKASDDAKEIEWIDIKNIFKYKYAFDHGVIVNDYIQWRNSEGTFWSSKRRN